MTKVLGYIEKGKQQGAKLMTGGKRVGTTGYYIEPTVFADVTDDMAIAKEEVSHSQRLHQLSDCLSLNTIRIWQITTKMTIHRSLNCHLDCNLSDSDAVKWKTIITILPKM